MVDTVLFIAFPYIAVILAVLVGIYRFKTDTFSYSSFSSQFLENKALFWGSVPWHYGIIIILLAHILAALFPRSWAMLISEPARLYILEGTGLALALMTIFGIGVLVMRRLFNPRIFAVTTTMDWVILLVLFTQVVLGFWVALFYRWGSDWYLYTVVPWFFSLLKFTPQIHYIAALPIVVKIHIFVGFLIIALFPFTRLVHIVSVPIAYLWRPLQVVIWNKHPREKTNI